MSTTIVLIVLTALAALTLIIWAVTAVRQLIREEEDREYWDEFTRENNMEARHRRPRAPRRINEDFKA